MELFDFWSKKKYICIEPGMDYCPGIGAFCIEQHKGLCCPKI